ncbi:ABC transporter permease [Streptacidiphilus jiangxiensis]|uniref:ABC-2 family transporter protein n=1 Tax=Streptacidiphilus jiangxiensis TaxID=235985 RepID=A0A1H7L528_STRJI|nr:ABC transporter permease subunit [Streptacidiphilus jiangxiensis]SEK93934.1 ABC-2 family transporter protein [Streptacidiphilus jiangxiensis]
MSAPTWQLVPLKVRRIEEQPARIGVLVVAGLALRRHRRLIVTTGLGLLVLACWTLTAARSVAASQADWFGADCGDARATTACEALGFDLTGAVRSALYAQLALVTVPLLVGALLGAPLLAREYEQGTHRTAWTQAVTRGRWLAGQLLVLGGTSLLTGLVAAALGVRLIQASSPAVFPESSGFGPVLFNSFGPLLAAGTLLAFAVGVLCGALWRRTLPAIGATVAGYGGLALLLTAIRGHLWPARTIFPPHGYDLRPDDWLMSDGVVTVDGHRLSYAQCGPEGDCPAGSRTFEIYHPAAQLWPMQWTVAAIMLALGLAAVLLSYRALERNRL